MSLFDTKPSYEELEARVVELEQEVASLRKKKPATAKRFGEFWTAYPNKKGRAEAEKRWKADGLDEKTAARLRRKYAKAIADLTGGDA